MIKFAGIFIASHKVCDADSKEKAIKTLTNWQLESCTAEQWIQKLEGGQTIQPSAFSPKHDGTFTHGGSYVHDDKKINLWNSTHFVCADADNIKGVETLNNGSDKNPEGVDLWTEQNGLSKLYPTLGARAYAVGQSVSSMLKEPLHRRYRLIFLFDKPITTEAHYHHVLLKLADEFPIIPAVERSPAQPVFGNAREGYNQFHTCGNILSLDDFPFTPPENKPQSESQPRLDFDETLDEYLRRHGIDYTPANEPDKYYVTCPYKDNHTGGINKLKDAYVSISPTGWAFYCSHAHCESNRTWQAFKKGNGIANLSAGTPKPKTVPIGTVGDHLASSSLPKLEPKKQSDAPVFPDEDGNLFPGGLEFLYHAYWGNNVFCKPFLLAMGLTAIGVCSGRKAFVTIDGDSKGGRVDFPNVYTALLGQTTVAAKSDCRKVLHDLLYAVDNFLPVIAIDSREGFAADLRTDGEGTIDKWNEGDLTEGVRCLVSLDELRSLFVASRREVTSNIPSYLNDLWSCPRDASTRQKNNPIQVDYPVVNIFGCSTPNWLQKSVIGDDIDGGFINRFMPFLYERMPYVRNQTVNSDCYDSFVSMLRGFLSVPEGAKHYSFDGEAAESYHVWAEARYEAAQSDPVAAAITSRIADHARRIALAFALATNGQADSKISLKAWEPAQKVAEYLSDVAIYIFSEVGRDSDAVLERKILDKLSELGNEAKASEILASFASRERPAAKVFHQIIEGLMRSDIVSLVSLKPKVIRRVG